jgi:hypothetical protein
VQHGQALSHGLGQGLGSGGTTFPPHLASENKTSKNGAKLSENILLKLQHCTSLNYIADQTHCRDEFEQTSEAPHGLQHHRKREFEDLEKPG